MDEILFGSIFFAHMTFIEILKGQNAQLYTKWSIFIEFSLSLNVVLCFLLLEVLRGDEIVFRNQGQDEDEETRLYYNRFRYYDSSTGSYISQDPIRLQGGSRLCGYVIDINSWVDILGLSTVYLRNNEVYVGKAKVNAKTRYSNKSTATDIFTGIPNTDVAQGVEQYVFERIQVFTNEGKLDPFTNANNPVNLKDKTKVYRYDDGEKWLKDNFGDNYNDIID